MILLRVGGALAIGTLALGASANSPQNITAAEMSKLPPYCQAAQTFSPGGFPEGPLPQQKPWVAKMGRAFWGIHHYCWALIGAHRASMPGVKDAERIFLYNTAIADVHFVLKNSQPGFVLLPELYLRLGDYHIEVARYGEALEWYGKSRAEKPDYWPPYLRQAELLAGKLNRRDEAIKLLQEGVLKMPKERRLVEALQKLGGAMPVATQAPAAPASAASAP